MKRWIRSPTHDMYYDEIAFRDDPDDTEYLGTAAMNGVETLEIFEDDRATREELVDAVVNYVDRYYIIDDAQRQWLRTNIID